jgi:hypothetical protein
LAEEPHQSLDVLRSRWQEELLPHELQSPQAQATQTNLMECCKQAWVLKKSTRLAGEIEQKHVRRR